MKKIISAILILLVVFGLFILKNIWEAGTFKTINSNFKGSTVTIDGIAGSEDITIDQTTGIAFISSDDRWATYIKKQPVKGGIYTLKLNDSIHEPENLTEDFRQQDFHPHGISLFRTKAGKTLLFVVNHRAVGNFIEIFEYRNDSLFHTESISDPLLVSPNDVVAVGERAFYVTNDHNEKPSSLRSFKDLLTIGTGNLCYFDGTKMIETSISGEKYANGVNISADGKTLYLAATTARKILICSRNAETGAITRISDYNTNTGVDNIELDTDGNLWIGCHPQMLKFLSHAKNEKALSPSEIIKLTQLDDGNMAQKTIYLNDGSEISASSVGAVYKNKLLIGPVFQRIMVLAEMK